MEGNASKTTATAWLANSDARIKQDVAPLTHAVGTLMRIRPVSFRYTDAYRAAHPSIEKHAYYNVIAQEYAEVFPDAVHRSGETLPGAKRTPESEILQVDIHPALITTIAATQELAVEAQLQRERMNTLERENQQLRQRLEEIDALLARR